MIAGTVTPPRYAVNATSLPHTDAWTAIDDVAATGGQGIGLWERTMPAAADDRDGELVDRLAAAGLDATFCVPATHLILPSQIDPPGAPAALDDRVAAISDSIRRFAPIDPVMIVIGPGASGRADEPAGPVDAIDEALVELDRVAGSCGVTIGLEVLAARRGSALPTIGSVVDTIDRVGAQHTELMVSMFHSWDQPDLERELTAHVDRILGVQVCDIRDPERSAFDRELPGRGRGIAPAFMRRLLDAGYSGWWELEIFSDDGTYGTTLPDSYWAMPVRSFLADARAAFDSAHDRATTPSGGLS